MFKEEKSLYHSHVKPSSYTKFFSKKIICFLLFFIKLVTSPLGKTIRKRALNVRKKAMNNNLIKLVVVASSQTTGVVGKCDEENVYDSSRQWKTIKICHFKLFSEGKFYIIHARFHHIPKHLRDLFLIAVKALNELKPFSIFPEIPFSP